MIVVPRLGRGWASKDLIINRALPSEDRFKNLQCRVFSSYVLGSGSWAWSRGASRRSGDSRLPRPKAFCSQNCKTLSPNNHNDTEHSGQLLRRQACMLAAAPKTSHTVRCCLSVPLTTGRKLGSKLGPEQDAQTTLLTAHNASCFPSLAVSNAGQVPRRSRHSDSLDRQRLPCKATPTLHLSHLQSSLAGMSSRLTGMQSLLAMACVLIIIGATTTGM